MDKDKILSLIFPVIAYVVVALWLPSGNEKVLVPGLAAVFLCLITAAWQVASYVLLRYGGAGSKVVGHYVSFNREEKEIGLFSISVKIWGLAYHLEGNQYSIGDGRKVGSWASSAPLAVEPLKGGPRISYMYIGLNTKNGASNKPNSTRGYSSIQFIGEGFKRGVGLYIDDTQIDRPVAPRALSERALAQINYSTYRKLESGLAKNLAKCSDREVFRNPKLLLRRLANMPEQDIEHFLDGAG